MAGTYHTPGVYVEEISSFPASISSVQTSVPAFVGYTEKVPTEDPNKIASMLEFEALYGGPDLRIRVTVTGTTNVDLEPDGFTNDDYRQHNLWYAMTAYFANGGGPCYVASAGAFPAIGAAAQITEAALNAALNKFEPLDEPTLLVAPEAYFLSHTDLKKVVENMLGQAGKLKDRFAILDAKPDTTENPSEIGFKFDTYRTNVGTQDLSYGASYYPHLETIMKYRYNGDDGAGFDRSMIVVALTPDLALSVAEPGPELTAAEADAIELYITNNLADEFVALPPSSLIAGVYCTVDRTRGVWKAPANISLNYIKKPLYKMSAAQLDDMNIPDDGGGKTVNAIRTFTGRGHLVWGARTLDGNSNEWRYIPVRRLYNMVEESCKKATEFVVFEPNDANTWTRTRAMIENYLTGLWRQGALAGSKPEQAFFVNVGLGSTMTPQDILEGRMIVEIGMAAVRPAEFIVLKFSHKIAE